eukprot:GEMP01000818.1.p1 GENE.GEMP01000818.1~~GEMP01000818.1.p1  ORF type:complete len:1700 (+),score=301.06 GEMP01000818.1:352-5100(+)
MAAADLRHEFSTAEQVTSAHLAAVAQSSREVREIQYPQRDSVVNHAPLLVESEDLIVVAHRPTDNTPPNDVPTHWGSTMVSQSTQQTTSAPSTTVPYVASEGLLATDLPPRSFSAMRSPDTVAYTTGRHESASKAEPEYAAAEGSTQLPSLQGHRAHPPFVKHAPPITQAPTPILTTLEAQTAPPGVPHTLPSASFNEQRAATITPTYVAHNTPSVPPAGALAQPPTPISQEYTAPIAPTYQERTAPIAPAYQERTTPIALTYQEDTALIALTYQEHADSFGHTYQKHPTPIALTDQQETAPIVTDYQERTAPIGPTYQEQTAPIAPTYQDNRAPIAPSYHERPAPTIPTYQEDTASIGPSYQGRAAPISPTCEASSVPFAPPTVSPVQPLASIPKAQNAPTSPSIVEYVELPTFTSVSLAAPSTPDKEAQISSRSLAFKAHSSQRTSSASMSDRSPRPPVKVHSASRAHPERAHSGSIEPTFEAHGTADYSPAAAKVRPPSPTLEAHRASCTPPAATHGHSVISEKQTLRRDPHIWSTSQTQTVPRSRSLGASADTGADLQVGDAFTVRPHPGFQLLAATQNAHSSPHSGPRTSQNSVASTDAAIERVAVPRVSSEDARSTALPSVPRAVKAHEHRILQSTAEQKRPIPSRLLKQTEMHTVPTHMPKRSPRPITGTAAGLRAGVTVAPVKGSAAAGRALQPFSRRTPLSKTRGTRPSASPSPTGGTHPRGTKTPPRAVTPLPHGDGRKLQARVKGGADQATPAKVKQRQTSPDQQRTTPAKNHVTTDKGQITTDQILSSSDQRRISPRQRQTSPDQQRATSDKADIATNKSGITTDKSLSSSDQRQTKAEHSRASLGQRQTTPDRARTSPNQSQTITDPRRTNNVKDSSVETRHKQLRGSSRDRSPAQANRVEESRTLHRAGAAARAAQSSAPMKGPKRKAEHGAAATAKKSVGYSNRGDEVSDAGPSNDLMAADASLVHSVVDEVEKEDDDVVGSGRPSGADDDDPSVGWADKMRDTNVNMLVDDEEDAILSVAWSNNDDEEMTNGEQDALGLSHIARRISAEQQRFSDVAAGFFPHAGKRGSERRQRVSGKEMMDSGDEVMQALQLAAQKIESTSAHLGRGRTRDLSHHSPILAMSARNLSPSGTTMALRKSLFLRERHLNVTSELHYSRKSETEAGTKRLSHEWPVGIYATTNGEGVLVERKGKGTYKVSLYLVGSASERVLESNMVITGDQCIWGRMVAKRDPPDFYWTDKVKPQRDKSWFCLQGDAIVALLSAPPGPEEGLAFLRLAVWYFMSRNEMNVVAIIINAMKDRPKGPFDVAVLEHVVSHGNRMAIRAAVRALKGETVMHETLLKALEICPELGMDLIQTAPPSESREITQQVCSFQEPALIEPAVNALMRLNGKIDSVYMDQVLLAHIDNPMVVAAVAPFVDDVSWCAEIYRRYADHKDIGPAACLLVNSPAFLQEPDGVQVAKRAIGCLQSDSVEVQKSAVILLATWMQADGGAVKFLKQHTPIIKSIVRAARGAEDPFMTRAIECLAFFSEKEVTRAGGAGVLARKLLLEPSPGRRLRKENTTATSR